MHTKYVFIGSKENDIPIELILNIDKKYIASFTMRHSSNFMFVSTLRV